MERVRRNATAKTARSQVFDRYARGAASAFCGRASSTTLAQSRSSRHHVRSTARAFRGPGLSGGMRISIAGERAAALSALPPKHKPAPRLKPSLSLVCGPFDDE